MSDTRQEAFKRFIVQTRDRQPISKGAVIALALLCGIGLPIYLWAKGRISNGWAIGIVAALVIATAALFALPAPEEEPDSVSPTPQATTKPAPEPVTLTVAASGSGEQIAVTGTTNLPDGALVTVLVNRNVQYENDPSNEPRATPVANAGIKVSGGKFKKTLTADEAVLLSSADGVDFGAIEAVADTVVVCAIVRPNDDDEKPQPKNVMKVLGEGGKNLSTSPQKDDFGGTLRLAANAELVFPTVVENQLELTLGKEIKRQKTVADPFCAI